MSLQACLDLMIDQYAEKNEKKLSKLATARDAAQVKGLLNDFWVALLKLGNQVDWAKAMSHLWDMFGMLFSGKSIDEVVAWVLENFKWKKAKGKP